MHPEPVPPRMDTKSRCPWRYGKPLWRDYHDTEWGTPAHDDRVLFEFLILEGEQAGLSSDTILRKREGYRAAFAGFDPAKVGRFDARRRAALMQNPDFVHNRLKMDLKKRGFRFVGSTIMYAYMQAVGMVNDHIVTCYRHQEDR